MIVRIWTVDLLPGMESALNAFAHDVSLPMFRAQPGCLGVLFTRQGDRCATITLWRDQAALDQLAVCPDYQLVVEQIEESGILGGRHHIEVYDCYGGYLDPQGLAGLLAACRR